MNMSEYFKYSRYFTDIWEKNIFYDIKFINIII